jgi:flagellar biosynthesis/type III secretory pathway chaperone
MSTQRMDSTQLVVSLDRILLSQEAAAGVLLSALQAESQALKGRDAATLTLVTEEKVEALEQLEAIEEQRRDLCARIGAGPSQADMEAWLAAFTGSGGRTLEISARWASLTDLLRRCREVSQANAVIVASLQRRVQQGLSLIGRTSLLPPVARLTEDAAEHPSSRTAVRA